MIVASITAYKNQSNQNHSSRPASGNYMNTIVKTSFKNTKGTFFKK
jgi:hypothetical protein